VTRLSDPRSLGRVRAGARATLALGIGASLAANVLAAQPTVIGRVIAAWPPVALLVTVELLSRVPVAPGWLSRLRVVSAAAIAGIAAWVSYWHMAVVALEYGEASVAAHLLPFSVDGLVVVASVCLVELGRTTTAPEPSTAAPTRPEKRRRLEEPAPADRSEPSERPATAKRRKPTSAGGKRDQVRRLARQHPEWTQARLAQAAGCSVRTVRRHLDPPANPPVDPPAAEPAAPVEPAPPADPPPTGPTLPVDPTPPAPSEPSALAAATNGHHPPETSR
jgi:hypothetical protein